MSYYSYSEFMQFMKNAPGIPEPNLITGVGHGHFRPFKRDKPEKCHLRKLKTRTKMSKKSKQRNRA